MMLSYHASRMWDADPPFPMDSDPVSPSVADLRWPPVPTLPFGIRVRTEAQPDSETMGNMAPPCLVADGHGGIGRPPAVIVALSMASRFHIGIGLEADGAELDADEAMALGERIQPGVDGLQTWLPARPVPSLAARYWRRHPQDLPTGLSAAYPVWPLWTIQWWNAWSEFNDEVDNSAWMQVRIWERWPHRHNMEQPESIHLNDAGAFDCIDYWPALDRWTAGPGAFIVRGSGYTKSRAEGGKERDDAFVNAGGNAVGWRGERKTAEALFVGADYEYWADGEATLSGAVSVTEWLNRV